MSIKSTRYPPTPPVQWFWMLGVYARNGPQRLKLTCPSVCAMSPICVKGRIQDQTDCWSDCLGHSYVLVLLNPFRNIVLDDRVNFNLNS